MLIKFQAHTQWQAGTHVPNVQEEEDREQGLTWQPNPGQVRRVTTPSQQLA